MTDRAADDAAVISARLAAIQRDRMAAIAGCACPADMLGEITHTATCPLRPEASAPCPLTAFLALSSEEIQDLYRRSPPAEPDPPQRSVADLLAAADEHLAKIGWRP